METSRDPLSAALAAREKGIAAIPCRPGSKIPKVRWKEFQSRLPAVDEIRSWFRGECNVAIVTTGMVVFDCDAIEEVQVIFDECGDTPHVLRTPRGIHLGYRRRAGAILGNQVRIRGRAIDLRTDGGLEMIPPSCTEHGDYSWIGDGLRPIAELPVARIGWTRERSRRHVEAVVIDDSDSAVRRARGYLASIEGAISGQRGHHKTFRAANVLVTKFGLSFEQAFPLLKEWSDFCCEPPWSDAELTHKLRDAIRQRRG
ncbi:MAG TPA: bifunctional DNA primase/polymerase [Gemmataceae bacterium]|jgi:hypothetical protein|nr:bifunctional DNA primase/polymerase [Gemmataceae bacterium]